MVVFEILFKMIGGLILFALVMVSPFLCIGVPLFVLAVYINHKLGDIPDWLANIVVYLIGGGILAGYLGLLSGHTDWFILPGMIFWGGVLLYLVYLTLDFAVRLFHYYRLPNLNATHQTPSGGIDLDAAIRDAPQPETAQHQPAWKSHNQALRAAQALHGLTGEGASSALPDFLPERVSKIDAANEFVRAYTSYLWAATGAYITQREDELVTKGRKQQSL